MHGGMYFESEADAVHAYMLVDKWIDANPCVP